MESRERVVTSSMGTTEAKALACVWNRLGVQWTNETEDAEVLRREHSLPESLHIGAVFAGPNRADYFFDATGRYIGYGALDLHEESYFMERGKEDISALRYNGDRGVDEVQLNGRYSGMSTKTHRLKDLPEEGRERFIAYFSGLPSALGGLAYTGPTDMQEWDILRFTTESVLRGMSDEPPVDYLVTYAKPAAAPAEEPAAEPKPGCIRIDAYRIHRY